MPSLAEGMPFAPNDRSVDKLKRGGSESIRTTDPEPLDLASRHRVKAVDTGIVTARTAAADDGWKRAPMRRLPFRGYRRSEISRE